MGENVPVAGVREVTLKRRQLVEVLVLCLRKSKVGEIVKSETLRSLFESALGELWREGEFRLETVWKILCQQPNLSAAEVAPPLFAFKSFEAELGVRVRLPEALAAIPKAEQTRLLQLLPITTDELTALLKEVADSVGVAELSSTDALARETMKELSTLPPADRARSRVRPVLAIALLVAAVGTGVGIAFYRTHPPVEHFDLSDVADILQLEAGKRVDRSLTAQISDPRWNSLKKEERQRIATEMFDREAKKGIEAITLIDNNSEVRAIVSRQKGQQLLVIY